MFFFPYDIFTYFTSWQKFTYEKYEKKKKNLTIGVIFFEFLCKNLLITMMVTIWVKATSPFFFFTFLCVFFSSFFKNICVTFDYLRSQNSLDVYKKWCREDQMRKRSDWVMGTRGGLIVIVVWASLHGRSIELPPQCSCPALPWPSTFSPLLVQRWHIDFPFRTPGDPHPSFIFFHSKFLP